jgi:cell division protein FtsL
MQIAAFFGLVLAGYIIFSFGKVAIVSYQLRVTEAELQVEVNALSEEVARLEAQKEYVQTDDYVERAAREEFKMSRTGDRVIVPMIESGESSTPDESGVLKKPAAPSSLAPWQAWWALFFDQ